MKSMSQANQINSKDDSGLAIYRLIDHGNFSALADQLSGELQKKLHPRMALFFKSQEDIRKGQYADCVSACNEIIDRWGPHVTVYINRAWAYFQQEKLGAFYQDFKAVESVLRQSSSLLSAESKARAHLALGQFFEEMGRPYRASLEWERVLEMRSELEDDYVLRAQAHLLRMQSYFRLESASRNSGYWKLKCIPFDYPTPYIFDDVQYACSLHEWVEGWQHSHDVSLGTLLGRNQSSRYDLGFFLVSFLEEALLAKDKSQVESLLKSISAAKNIELKTYDHLLCEIARSWLNDRSLEKFSVSTFFKLRSKLSVSKQLSLGSLLVSLFAGSDEFLPWVSELRSWLGGLLGHLDNEDRHFWNLRYKGLFSEELKRAMSPERSFEVVSLDQQQLSISCADKLHHLKGSPLVFRLLKLFQDQQSYQGLGVEGVLNQLWADETPLLSHVYRLKNLIQRGNCILSSLTGIERPLRLNKLELRLDPRLRIDTKI